MFLGISLWVATVWCVWDHLFLGGCFCGDCPIFTMAPSRHEADGRCNRYWLLSGIHVQRVLMAVGDFRRHMTDSHFAQNAGTDNDNHSNSSIDRYFAQNEDYYDCSQKNDSENNDSNNNNDITADYADDCNDTIMIRRGIATTITITEVFFLMACISEIVISFVRLWPGAL